jgi:hypothetical protein
MESMPPSPPARDQELEGNMELRPPSPPAQVPELQDTKGKGQVLLQLKIKTSRTLEGKCHLLLLMSKTFLCILL